MNILSEIKINWGYERWIKDMEYWLYVLLFWFCALYEQHRQRHGMLMMTAEQISQGYKMQ
jgi:hypothetical protein